MSRADDTKQQAREELNALFRTSFDRVVRRLPSPVLAELGESVKTTEPAVKDFNNPRNREFYKNRGKIEAALVRIWSVGSARDCQAMLEVLKKHRDEQKRKQWWKFWDK